MSKHPEMVLFVKGRLFLCEIVIEKVWFKMAPKTVKITKKKFVTLLDLQSVKQKGKVTI